MKILAYFQALWILGGCVSWFSTSPSVPEWLPTYQASAMECGDWDVLPDEISRRDLINFESGKSGILASYWLRSGRKAYAFEALDGDGDVQRDGEARFFIDDDERVIAGSSQSSGRMVATLKYSEKNTAIISIIDLESQQTRSMELPYQLDELVSSYYSHQDELTLLSRFYEGSGAVYHWAQIQVKSEGVPFLKGAFKLKSEQINDIMPVRLSGNQNDQQLAFISQGDAIQLQNLGSKKSHDVFSVADMNEEMIDFEYAKQANMDVFSLTSRNRAGETVSRIIVKAKKSKKPTVTKLAIGGREILTPKFVLQKEGPVLLGIYQELGRSHLVGFQLDQNGALTRKRYFRDWPGEVSLISVQSSSEAGVKLFLGRRYKGNRTQFFCSID